MTVDMTDNERGKTDGNRGQSSEEVVITAIALPVLRSFTQRLEVAGGHAPAAVGRGQSTPAPSTPQPPRK